MASCSCVENTNSYLEHYYLNIGANPILLECQTKCLFVFFFFFFFFFFCMLFCNSHLPDFVESVARTPLNPHIL